MKENLLSSRNSKKQLDQNALEHTLQTRKELTNSCGEKKKEQEYGMKTIPICYQILTSEY